MVWDSLSVRLERLDCDVCSGRSLVASCARHTTMWQETEMEEGSTVRWLACNQVGIWGMGGVNRDGWKEVVTESQKYENEGNSGGPAFIDGWTI